MVDRSFSAGRPASGRVPDRSSRCRRQLMLPLVYHTFPPQKRANAKFREEWDGTLVFAVSYAALVSNGGKSQPYSKGMSCSPFVGQYLVFLKRQNRKPFLDFLSWCAVLYVRRLFNFLLASILQAEICSISFYFSKTTKPHS